MILPPATTPSIGDVVTVAPGFAQLGSPRGELTWLMQRYQGLDAAWFAEERTEQTTWLAEFEIGIYPVTNGEYAAFVADGGYRRPELWPADSRDWLNDARRDRPKFWAASRWAEWCSPTRPVVGVTWYEAVAYARWTGRRLPTEDEWERAARGTQARRYPWGQEFVLGRANVADHWCRRVLRDVEEWRRQVPAARPWRQRCLTTPVDAFPDGMSPCGSFDMAGNVWEWCADGSTKVRVLRGGSFGYMSWSARTTERAHHPPWWCSLGIGFRIGSPFEHKAAGHLRPTHCSPG